MSDLKKGLEDRFGKNRVSDFIQEEDAYIDLLKIDIETKHSMTIIMTNGISSYQMPSPERYKEWEHSELFFCLPSYWDIDDKDNPNMNWPLQVINKLAKNVIENKTWYGPGHTIANGNPPAEISETMKQEYFLLAEPILLEDILSPLQIGDKTVTFLAIVPLFFDEFERKMHQGYPKWIRKFRGRNGNELLDDYRQTIYRSRWKGIF